MPTERLWVTEPRRSTCLATVTAVRGDRFALDRSVFAPRSRSHRHPQPADAGTVWVRGGEKRWLTGVEERDGEAWHRLRGIVPPVGSQLQCALDRERRDLVSRSHTALHLLLAALGPSMPSMAADPEVKLGGTFRLDLAHPVPPAALADALRQVAAWVEADLPVAVEPMTRDAAERLLTPQVFQPPDPWPGPPDVVQTVSTGDVCRFPCDGTHAPRTRAVGRVVVQHAGRRGGAMSVVGSVRG